MSDGEGTMRLRKLVACITAVLLLVGCSKATPENFEKIQVGMKRNQVHQILGKPSKVEGNDSGPASLYLEIWNNDPIVVTITFEGEVVAMKSLHGDQAQQ
jgi:hypothetical protein